MHAESHRIRFAIIIALLTLLALLFARPSHGAWGVEPVFVAPLGIGVPLVSAASDGASGAFVFYEEATITGGILRAQHLLANGERDPSWVTPAYVSDFEVQHQEIGAVPDGAGGAYAWWIEGANLYLSRLTPSGGVGSGWPARGRLMGALGNRNARPQAVADGTGGIYLGWLEAAPANPFGPVSRVYHLGPDNTARGGWPNTGRAIGNGMPVPSYTNAFGIAPASDGGLWVVAASSVLADTGGFEPGEVRVRRLTAAGLNAPGWTGLGVPVASFRGDLLFQGYQDWRPTPAARLTTIAEDPAGGVFVLFDALHDGFGGIAGVHWAQHLTADGALTVGWPVGGRLVGPEIGLPTLSAASDAGSLRLFPDPRGGAMMGWPEYFSEGGAMMTFERGLTSGGTQPGEGASAYASHFDVVPLATGGVAVASCVPSGPYGPYSPSAFITAGLSGQPGGYQEVHPEPVLDWYGDVALASTADGGAIFVWSQRRDRLGVFALRLSPSGAVLSVPPGATRQPFAARFVRGHGIVLSVGSDAAGAECVVHDVQGRALLSQQLQAGAGGEHVLAGSGDLSPGVYFVRTRAAGAAFAVRVLVLR